MPYRPANVRSPLAEGPPQPEPGVVYRWLDSSDTRKLAGWLMSWGSRPGYALTQGAPRKRAEDNAYGKAGQRETSVEATVRKAEELGFTADWVDKSTNRIKYGELVLAQIPVDEYQRRVAESLGEQRAMQGALDTQLEEQNEALAPHGITMFKRQHGEIEDRKRFARGERPSVRVPAAPSDLPGDKPSAT